MTPLHDRIVELALQREQAARVLQENGGRGVETAELIDRLDAQIAVLETSVLLACPRCKGYEELADVTMYPGVCDGLFSRLADGTIEFDTTTSETEIIWDAGEAPKGKKSVQCEACGWVGRNDQLVEHVPEEDDEPECEDCSVNGADCQQHGEAAKLALAAIHANPERVVESLAWAQE